ncbi:VOC family protein [Novosphingobium piscinae]|uniref:VOC family protein n=1 Tax=Novosphingobium piscinae TaxID=1507448 RepID=A0A7X1KQN9_9SPHN|nr:VOC family protein [Novosphingobium piscinae]MBC2669899.1 VOC family protein [Novosphingobium piscinae]
MSPGGLPIRQVAYFCADVRAAALAHHRRFGSGPFFVADGIEVTRSLHRGVERPFDHSSAYGQWGELMIEFVQQNNSGPSALHDLYPEGSGRWGLHHVALFVDDVDAAIARLDQEGFPLAQRSVRPDGFVFAFVDTSAAYGHMTELYAPTPGLTGFYRMVAEAGRKGVGTEVLIPLTL